MHSSKIFEGYNLHNVSLQYVSSKGCYLQDQTQTSNWACSNNKQCANYQSNIGMGLTWPCPGHQPTDISSLEGCSSPGESWLHISMNPKCPIFQHDNWYRKVTNAAPTMEWKQHSLWRDKVPDLQTKPSAVAVWLWIWLLVSDPNTQNLNSSESSCTELLYKYQQQPSTMDHWL